MTNTTPTTSTVEALRKGGLDLPDGASGASVETRSIEGRSEAYLIKLIISKSRAQSLVRQVGGPAHRLEYLDDAQRQALGLGTSRNEWRVYHSVWAEQDPTWWRTVIVDEKDPAHLLVLIEHVP